MVKMVEALLKAEEREDMRAAIITDNINPISPCGNVLRTSCGKARFEQPSSLPHAALHDSESGHAMISGNSTRDIIPGIIIVNMGRVFKKPANTVPARACTRFLAPSVLCTITWSVHQYHMPVIGSENITPIHGKSSSSIGRNI